MSLNQELLNQQFVKKNRAFTWRWNAGPTRADRTFDLKLLTHAMKFDKSMQKFELKCNGCLFISDKRIHYISQTLKRLPCLKGLSLSFLGSARISNRGLFWLCEGLNNLRSLEKLSLGLRHLQDQKPRIGSFKSKLEVFCLFEKTRIIFQQVL